MKLNTFGRGCLLGDRSAACYGEVLKGGILRDQPCGCFHPPVNALTISSTKTNVFAGRRELKALPHKFPPPLTHVSREA